jgi:hypothetical protein
MIALLIMPIIIEMITRGVMIQMAGGTVLTLAVGMLAEGDLCALTWLPFMAMCAWNDGNGLEPLPPERAEYIPRKLRIERGNWPSSNVPTTWKTAWNAWTA